MTRKRKAFVAVAVGIGVLAAAAALYLTVSDLSGWRDTVARIASNAMDRELTIAGDFEVDVGLVTRVHATEVGLANAGWGSEPKMARIDRLDAEIALWPLVRGSIVLPAVDIDGGRALFETDAATGSNWALGAGGGPGGGTPVRLRIDRIHARDVELVFHRRGDRSDLDLAVTSLDSTGDESGHHELVAEGALGGTRVAVEGRVGPLDGLVNLTAADHDLVVRVGTARAESRGSIAELATLSGLDVELHATVPDPAEITAPAGLPAFGAGPLTVDLTCEGVGALTSFTAAVTAEEFSARGNGTIDSLVAPGDLDVEIDVSGSDIRPIAALRGIDGLSEAPFDLRGALRWRGFPITVTGLEVRVGDNHLSADGTLGAPPTLLDTDLRFTGGGPDASALAALLGASLPARPFELRGHLLRIDDGVRVDDVRFAVGATSLTATGIVGDPPEYAGTDLTLEVSGPDSSSIRVATGLALPSGPFSLTGRLAEGDRSIALHGVRATLAGDDATLDGRLTTETGMKGTELRFTAEIHDLSRYAGIVGLDELPAIALTAEGGLGFVDDGWRLDRIHGRSGELDAVVDGVVTRRAGLVGSHLSVDASGPDLAAVNDLVPVATLPSERFAVKGRLSFADTGIDLTGVELRLGGAEGRIDGRIGGDRRLDDSDLSVDVRGPDLSLLDPFVRGVRLPAIGFSAVGCIGVHDGSVDLTDVALTVGDTTAQVAGAVTPSDGFTGTEVTVDLTGSNLADFAGLVADTAAIELPTLPASRFSAEGQLTVDAVGYHLPKLELVIGPSTASVRGVIGREPGWIGTDLELGAAGPDGAVLANALGVDLPRAPMSIEGRLVKDRAATRFDGVKVRVGDFRADIEGTLGPLPRLVGTDLSVSAAGPDLSAFAALIGTEKLPPLAFAVNGRFNGDPTHFTGDSIRLQLGSSDVAGGLKVDLDAKPTFSATLASRRLAIAELIGPPPSSDEADSGSEQDPGGLLLSDEPLNLSLLDRIDGRLDWTIDDLAFRLNSYHDVDLVVDLRDSRVNVETFRGTGVRGGVLQGSGSMAPDPAGYRIEGRLTLDDAMVNLGDPDADTGSFTELDVALDLGGSGRSPHQLMAGADGTVVLSAVGGEVRKSVADLISADVLMTLLHALNPFAKSEATELDCAVLAATFDHGVMTLDPGAIQTDAMTILGDGTVDFSTEKLTLDWVSKPRKGVGLSASAITNSYIRLGGTLRDPSIEIKPLEAFATTGVAVVTMGISLIAKGLFDRVTAEKKVCKRAMEKVDEMKATTSPQQ